MPVLSYHIKLSNWESHNSLSESTIQKLIEAGTTLPAVAEFENDDEDDAAALAITAATVEPKVPL